MNVTCFVVGMPGHPAYERDMFCCRDAGSSSCVNVTCFVVGMPGHQAI